MKPFLLFFGLLLLTLYSFSQSTWKWYNPHPDGIRLNAVNHVDENHAWAVGDQGKIVFWDGHHWNRQASNCTNTLRSVSFSDPYHGWAVGDSGRLLGFENGAWADYSLSTKPLLKYVAFFGDDGWIFGDTVMRFQDGQWEIYPWPDSAYVFDVSFSQEDNGWAACYLPDGRCLLHFDGNSWEPIQNINNDYFFKCSFSDSQHGLLASHQLDNDILTSYHHGVINPSFSTSSIRAIFMVDSVTGYAAGRGGIFFAGDTRCYIYKFESDNWLLDTILATPVNAFHGDTDRLWAVGESGITYLNENGIWKLMNAQFDQSLVAMSFPDPDHGWIITDANHLLKYRKGVISEESYYPDYNLVDLQFQDSLNGFVLADFKQAGNYFHLLKYINGSWSDQGVYSTDYPVRMNVLDPSHIWVLMSESIMFYDGMGWDTQLIDIEYPEILEDICMLSPASGFAIGNRYMDYSFIYRFDGVSWTRITSGLPGNMYRISAIDDEWIWVINHLGKIIRYNTITETWVEESYVHEFWYDTDIQMINSSEGYALSLNGILRYDGTTWSHDTTMPSVGFTCLDFSHPGYYWLGGEYGAMASTYMDSPLSVEKRPVFAALKARVYPNPLSSSSVIEYEVNQPAQVKIEISDMQGRKLKAINEGFRQAGKYQVSLDILNLESGIYTCRIQVGRQLFSIKVVIQ
jgi:photosystem II stability/assembly factor-like uncharacterized protein